MSSPSPTVRSVNGAELARGFNDHLPPGVLLTGGLAGDGTRFERTVVGLDDSAGAGPHRRGWVLWRRPCASASDRRGAGNPSARSREVTRAAGQHAVRARRPLRADVSTGRTWATRRSNCRAPRCAFPLCMTPARLRSRRSCGPFCRLTRPREHDVRGRHAQSARGSGSCGPHTRTSSTAPRRPPNRPGATGRSQLVICVSCVGRRIVLGQRTEEETESVRTVIGASPSCRVLLRTANWRPASGSGACQLHNQTMTITSLFEV